MLQQDTRQVLLPVMPDAFHPAIVRLKQLLSPVSPAAPSEPGIMLPPQVQSEGHYKPAGAPGTVQLLERSARPKEGLPVGENGTPGDLQLIESNTGHALKFCRRPTSPVRSPVCHVGTSCEHWAVRLPRYRL